MHPNQGTLAGRLHFDQDLLLSQAKKYQNWVFQIHADPSWWSEFIPQDVLLLTSPGSELGIEAYSQLGTYSPFGYEKLLMYSAYISPVWSSHLTSQDPLLLPHQLFCHLACVLLLQAIWLCCQKIYIHARSMFDQNPTLTLPQKWLPEQNFGLSTFGRD